MKTLFLSIWHNWGWWDQGASANGTTEAIEVKKIIDSIMKQWIPWITLIKVPEKLTLTQRINWINNNLAWKSEPLSMEFHLDSWPVTASGASVRYNDNNEFTHQEWRQFLQKYTEITWFKSRWVNSDTTNRHGQLWFVSQIKCASLLIELWFISNPKELENIRSTAVKWIIESVKNMNAK